MILENQNKIRKMGIKNLSKFLRETFPHLFEEISLSEYAFERVAIDISLYLCNYKALYGDQGWLAAFLKLVACLRENEIHPVFIYDSGFPPEKINERKKRSDSRANLEDKVTCLEIAIEKYNETGEIEPLLLDFQEKKKIQPEKRLLKKDFSAPNLNIRAIEYAVKKMRKQLFTINPSDFETTKKLFEILDIPYFNAPMEAETTCSDLCKQGKVTAVVSEDTDVLAYGAPTFLTKVNTTNSTCMRISYEKVLESTGFTPDQFLDFCIMCGTDYNKNIPRIGPKKAFQLIANHGNIETLKEMNIDISALNHNRSRELFLKYERVDYKLGYCGFPDLEKLKTFIFENGIRFDMDTVKRTFFRDHVTIEEGDKKINDQS